jgi:hypothetical protein
MEESLEAKLARVGMAQALLSTKDWELQCYAQDILREQSPAERERLIRNSSPVPVWR